MRKLVMILAASSLLLAGCDESPGEGATADFVAGLIASTDGRIDPKDPGKTLQNTLSGDTLGNTSEDPALRTTRSIAGQKALDDADQYAGQLEGKERAEPADYNAGIAKYDRALSLIPDDTTHAQQRAEALASRASLLESSANDLRSRGEEGDASGDLYGAGQDYETAARKDLRDPVHGNDLADAARAYYDGGFTANACALAHEAARSRTDDDHARTAIRILELAKCK